MTDQEFKFKVSSLMGKTDAGLCRLWTEGKIPQKTYSDWLNHIYPMLIKERDKIV